MSKGPGKGIGVGVTPGPGGSGLIRRDGGGPGLETPPAPAEQPCPNCGQPMLVGWGTTCGTCRPNLAAPKTIFRLGGEATGTPMTAAMTLGWVVVVRSPDTRMSGSLVELTNPITILSRTGGTAPGTKGNVEFADEFMSVAHAWLARPNGSDRNGSFTIRDRDNPGPSANGTFVNSHKLGPGEVVRLSDGDSIHLGSTELLFKSLWLPPVPSGQA